MISWQVISIGQKLNVCSDCDVIQIYARRSVRSTRTKMVTSTEQNSLTSWHRLVYTWPKRTWPTCCMTSTLMVGLVVGRDTIVSLVYIYIYIYIYIIYILMNEGIDQTNRANERTNKWMNDRIYNPWGVKPEGHVQGCILRKGVMFRLFRTFGADNPVRMSVTIPLHVKWELGTSNHQWFLLLLAAYSVPYMA